MSSTTKLYIFAFLSLCLVTTALASVATTRMGRLFRLPFLGPRCSDCPPNFCDDDEAVVTGYCCGCARFLDHLPVACGAAVRCPLNNYDLCESYEYMMHCCCSS